MQQSCSCKNTGGACAPRFAACEYPAGPQHEFLADDSGRTTLTHERGVRSRPSRQTPSSAGFPSCRRATGMCRRTASSSAACCIARSTCMASPCIASARTSVCLPRARRNACADRAVAAMSRRRTLIIAGDFQRLRNQLSHELAGELNVHDAFHLGHARLRAVFPLVSAV